jgi:hypothetical protein
MYMVVFMRMATMVVGMATVIMFMRVFVRMGRMGASRAAFMAIFSMSVLVLVVVVVRM